MRPGTAHLLFASLIDWHLKSNHDGWPATSLLYNMARGGGRTTPGHKILCRDMNKDLRLIQHLFNHLSHTDRIIVISKHMPPPVNEEGEPLYEKWGDKEKSKYLNEPIGQYKSKYRRICRQVESRARKGIELTQEP